MKPQNVLLNGNGEAKVTDFGIARPIEVRAGDDRRPARCSAPRDYISPEQAQGRHVDELTDVYSLGVVLYELLTGEVPFTRRQLRRDRDAAHQRPAAARHASSAPDVPPRRRGGDRRGARQGPGRRASRRWPSFERELEACLVEVREAATIRAPPAILPVVKPRRAVASRGAPRPPHRPPARSSSSCSPVLAARGDRDGRVPRARTTAAPPRPTGMAAGRRRSGPRGRPSRSYDPAGDGREHDGEVPLATDGNLATYWQTEHYANPAFGSLGKPGVGLVLDAGSPVDARTR